LYIFDFSSLKSSIKLSRTLEHSFVTLLLQSKHNFI